ncbi:MAG: hypothetical protein LBL45_04130 [Treponema sp.]|nr:hypothetical protein [Treponema sp.]
MVRNLRHDDRIPRPTGDAGEEPCAKSAGHVILSFANRYLRFMLVTDEGRNNVDSAIMIQSQRRSQKMCRLRTQGLPTFGVQCEESAGVGVYEDQRGKRVYERPAW